MVRNPVPLTVRGAIVLFMAAGIAVTMRLIQVKNQQDFYGGMGLIFLALVAFVASNDLPGMRGFAFGPGTAPRLFAFSLIALSMVVVIMGLIIPGPYVTRYKVRGVVFIIGAILTFAATIRTLGLVTAAFATIIICAAAADDVKWRETVIWAALLTAFCSFLFPYGLNLPFQLWPRF
jgi:putative tricarboxylic transport membrane protein